jgi:hypothetical protein
MALLRPTVWTQQPQQAVGIDWSNPITRGLQFAITPTVTLPFSDSSIKTASRNGIAYDYGASRQTQVAHQPGMQLTGALTLVVGCRARTFSNYSPLISKTDSADTNQPFELRLGDSATGAGLSVARANTSVKVFTVGGSAVTANTDLLIATTFPSGLIEAVPTFYYGQLGGSLTINASPAPAGGGSGAATDIGGKIYVGRRAGGVTQLDGLIYFSYGFNRVLSAAEIRSLSANPWQIFAPIRRQLFVADAGGGGVTGTGSLSQSAQTLSASGSVSIGATASLTQAAQTLASNGTVAIAGSASLSQAAQTLSATGTVAAAGSITGTATLNQTAQTLAATGLIAISGTASLAQSAQTLSASGAIQITGTGNLIELAETLSASGVVLTGITGSANLAQDAQTLTATATTLFPAIGRPSSDVSNSGWSPSTGSDLFAMLDEVTPSDTDYIVTSSLGSTCKLNLNATQYPGSSSQQLSLRASSSTGNGLSVTIKDGATVIATRSLTLTPSYDLHTITLTSGEIALISTGALTVELTSI